MKKNGLLFLFVLSTFDLFSQINNGNFVIAFDGNYMKTSTDNGVTTNFTDNKGQYLNISSSIGHFFTNSFVVGIGLDYIWVKEVRDNTLKFNNFIQEEEMKITSKALLPNLYLGYYYQIINNLYFNANIKFCYGKFNSEYTTLYAGMGLFNTDSTFINLTPHDSYVKGYSMESKYNYFSTKISPELTYFISPKFGINIGLGGIEYSIIDWKSNNSNWTVSFNPNYWKFGIKINLIKTPAHTRYKT